MKKSGQKLKIIKYKVLYTAIIILIYLIGRGIPLYGIDLSAYSHIRFSAEDFLLQTVGGDAYRYSLLALGISPYVVASIVTQAYGAYKRAGNKGKISPRKMATISLMGTMILAVLQAMMHVQDLTYRMTGVDLVVAKIISAFQMVVGVVIIIWLSERNQKYGIGGRTALIYVNIIDGVRHMIAGHNIEELRLPVLLAVALVFVAIILENTEFRIPVQRISIHNIYADKNYMAIKLNPIGMMPIMFSSAFFMVPQLIARWVVTLIPKNPMALWWSENMTLTQPLGMVVYIVIIYILTIVFSMIYVNPSELAEQYLKSGDSLLGIHAGKETHRYLSRTLRQISFVSATIMGICLGVPLFLQYIGDLDSALVMLPSSAMILTGMWSSLYQEYLAVKSYESYDLFF